MTDLFTLTAWRIRTLARLQGQLGAPLPLPVRVHGSECRWARQGGPCACVGVGLGREQLARLLRCVAMEYSEA